MGLLHVEVLDEPAIDDDADSPLLLDDVDVVISRGDGDVERSLEPGSDLFESEHVHV